MNKPVPPLEEYLEEFREHLKNSGVSGRKSSAIKRKARAFLLRHSFNCPPELIAYDSSADKLRDKFLVFDDKRTTPLRKDEREAFLACASRSGDSVPLRLRNAALISVLMSPAPAGVRPDHILNLSTSDITIDNAGPYSSWPTLGVTEKSKITHYQVKPGGSESDNDRIIVELNDVAQRHLSRYILFEDGWHSIRTNFTTCIWPAVGINKSMIGNKNKSISRQALYKLATKIGEDAGITGRIGPDILRKRSLEDLANAKSISP